MASVANLSINKGEGKTFVDSIVTTTGAAQNITGWGLVFYLHAVGDPGTQFLVKDNGANGGVAIIAAVPPATFPNQLSITFVPNDTGVTNNVGLRPGEYAFSVWRTDSSVPLKLTTGLFTIGSPA
jgi:hypothetical protein